MLARRIIKKKDARTCSQVTFTNRGCVKVFIAAAVDSIVSMQKAISCGRFPLKMKVGVLVKLFPFRKVVKVDCEESFDQV